MAKILLVEDNPDNRDLFARLLRFAGHEIVLAQDGVQAVALAQTEYPDLIVMDLQMPGLNGWQATKLLKTLTQTQHIPIIALTAHALTEDRIRGLAIGLDEYETKPVEFPKLLAKIDTLLSQTQQR